MICEGYALTAAVQLACHMFTCTRPDFINRDKREILYVVVERVKTYQ